MLAHSIHFVYNISTARWLSRHKEAYTNITSIPFLISIPQNYTQSDATRLALLIPQS